MKNVPIVVGVTGHRLLRNEDITILRKAVHNELNKIKMIGPNSTLILLDSLAIGADTICAEEALSLGYEIAVPLPFEIDEYRKDFSPDDLTVFNYLINQANATFEVSSISNVSRDEAYYEAGLYVARHSHVVITLYDGEPPKIDGCATAEVIDRIIKGLDENIIVPTPIATILHIYAPRISTKNIKEIGHVEIIENTNHSNLDTIKDTDEFNKDCINLNVQGSLIDKELLNKLDDDLIYFNDLYAKADFLSANYQKKYLKSLRVLSFFGAALVACLLFYDEFDSLPFLPLYGLFLMLSVYYVSKPKRGKWHEKYISYRTLAETLRIQFFVYSSGLYKNVGDLFPWAIREENDWIFKVLKVLEPVQIDTSRIDRKGLVNLWINEQLSYHQISLVKDGNKLKRNNRWSNISLLLSVMSFILMFIFEYFNPSIMNHVLFSVQNNILFVNSGTNFTIRGLFKVIVGLISAVAVILTNYYGKLSLDNKSDDHERYCGLYKEALKKMENPTDELIWELASEEMFINSAWITYSKENSPNVII